MGRIHGRGAAERHLYSAVKNTIGSLHQPASLAKFLRGAIKYPVEFDALKEVQATPETTFLELFPSSQDISITLDQDNLRRHSWNVRLDEEVYIGLAVRALNAKRIFEIGTFNGETTRYMAECAGPDANIFTLDLPPNEFDRDQRPEEFSGSRVGEVYRSSPCASRITQILEDSKRFDYSPFTGNVDFVFVDAAHDYIHGLSDSRAALEMVRPGGAIFWHDYVPFWAGLVHGIREATEGLPLQRLRATTLAVLRMPE